MSRGRIVRLIVIYAAVAGLLLAALFRQSIVQHDRWLERSFRNRWAFRDVPTRRAAIVDRQRVELAWDVPGFDLELTYHTFRRGHPLGAVRHGAELLWRAATGGSPWSYERSDQFAAALDAILDTPLPWLREDAGADTWPYVAEVPGYDRARDVAQDLRFYVVAAAASLSGDSRSRLAAAFRDAAAQIEDGRVVDALARAAENGGTATRGLRGFASPGGPDALRAALQRELGRRVAELRDLDARLLLRAAGGDQDFSLWRELEARHGAWEQWRRVLSLALPEQEALLDGDFWAFLHERGWTWRSWDDWLLLDEAARLELVSDYQDERDRRLEDRAHVLAVEDRYIDAREELPSLFAPLPREVVVPRFQDEVRPRRLRSRLAHPVAVWLSLLAERHPGFGLRPSVRRERGRLPGDDDLGSLALLVGHVGAYEPHGRSPEVDASRRFAEAGEFARIGDDVPDELEESARRSALRALLVYYRVFGRLGKSGVEAAMDGVLSGRPGLRWIERDKRARETRMFESLDVSPGAPVALTVDVRLQRLAERVLLSRGEPLPGQETALVVVEPSTGDVLAMVSRRRGAEDPEPSWGLGALMPGGTPYVGSVAKPLVALEYLRSLREGGVAPAAPLLPPAEFPPCAGAWDPAKSGAPPAAHRLSCAHSHGVISGDTTDAIAASCNIYFYEAASRLGAAGVRRAFGTFGWVAPRGEDDTFPAEVYQDAVDGLLRLPVGGPCYEGTRFDVARRGIGYAVGAWPAFVARAYAGLATGSVPRLRLVRDRPVVALRLPYTDAELEIVREGLRKCVQSGIGTARFLRPVADRLRAACGMELFGKTGTAVVADDRDINNAWFAGYVGDGTAGRLAFAAVVYRTADVGGAVAAPIAGSFLEGLLQDPDLAAEYLGGGSR